jgi:hypothetical protein
MIILKKTNKNKWLAKIQRAKETFIYCWWDHKFPLWKSVKKFLKKLTMDLPYNPVMPSWACKTVYNRGI